MAGPHTTASFLKTNWFLIVFGLGIISTLATAWFNLGYIQTVVNPAAVDQHNQWIQKLQFRHCLEKAILVPNPVKILECAD